jgi:hypothetical protein
MDILRITACKSLERGFPQTIVDVTEEQSKPDGKACNQLAVSTIFPESNYGAHI